MMTITKNVLKILFISLMFSFAACSSDDNVNNDDDDDNEVVEGGDHTYDIELVGDTETISLSGAMPNNTDGDLFSSLSTYVNSPEEEGVDVSTVLTNNTTLEAISVHFVLDDNRQSLYPLGHPEDVGEHSTLSIRPADSNITYFATSGTLNFSNVKYASATTTTGRVSYILDFQGVFQHSLDDDVSYEGSGTIVYSPLEFLNYN